MSTQDSFGAEITRLELALDRASDEAERILSALATESGFFHNGEPHESILTQINLLRRVTDGLRGVQNELQQSSAYPTVNLERELGIWERARDRYNEAKLVWDDLGTTLTEVIAAHLLGGHGLSGDKLLQEWQQAFPTFSDAAIAIHLVEGYPSSSRDSERYAIELSDKYLLQLRFMLGLTQSQIGKLTGVGQAAAATRLGRAVERLRPRVADQVLQNLALREDMNIAEGYTDLPPRAVAGYRISNFNRLRSDPGLTEWIYDVALFVVDRGILAKEGDVGWLMAASSAFRDIRLELIRSGQYVEVPGNDPPSFNSRRSPGYRRRIFVDNPEDLSSCHINVVALYDPEQRGLSLTETGDFCEQTAYLCSLIDGQGVSPSYEWGTAWQGNLPSSWLYAFNFGRHIDSFERLFDFQNRQENSESGPYIGT